MGNLKVGDLAYVGSQPNRLGVITKFVRVGNYKGYVHYYATVFIFKTADSFTVPPCRLTKVEVESE